MFAVDSAPEKASVCALLGACAPPHHQFPVRIKSKRCDSQRIGFEKTIEFV